MKRVKIMLMAICLVAVAGGVLAFKTMTNDKYCTTLAVTTVANGPKFCPQNLLTCPNFVITVTSPTTITTGNITCYTLAPNPDAPVLADRCKTTTEFGGPLVTTKCSIDEIVLTEP